MKTDKSFSISDIPNSSSFTKSWMAKSLIPKSLTPMAAATVRWALAGFLMQHGVDTLICGGIGGGAQMALAEAGIRLYGGVSGDADAAVNALLSDELAYNPDVRCNHHDHEHGEGGHTCGHHGCGSHSCH